MKEQANRPASSPPALPRELSGALSSQPKRGGRRRPLFEYGVNALDALTHDELPTALAPGLKVRRCPAHIEVQETM